MGLQSPNFYMNTMAMKVAADCISPWVKLPTEHLMRCRHRLVYPQQIVNSKRKKNQKRKGK